MYDYIIFGESSLIALEVPGLIGHNMCLMKIKPFCMAVIFLFGTFLHEFSHFTVALLLGKPSGFSLVPRRVGDVFVFGEVKARVRYKVLGLFIASAPLIWWVLLFFAGDHLIHKFKAVILSHSLKSFTLREALFMWLVFQLLWAGRLSFQDIRTCKEGIVSPSGLFCLAVLVLMVQIFRYIGQ